METSQLQATAKAPRSWAEDLNTYREARGSRSHATLRSKDDVPARFARTTLVPFAATRHPLFSQNDFIDGCETTRSNPETQSDKWSRHGWGDVTLLKEEGYAGIPHPRGVEVHRGKAVPPALIAKDGRADLFGTLQYTEVGHPDSWLGNGLIDPTKGKGRVPSTRDKPTSFLSMTTSNPGSAHEDAWIGNPLMHPGSGKAKPLGPEQRRGRRDLTDIYNYAILRESKETQQLMLQKGQDPLADGWIGHPLVSFGVGKLHVPNPIGEDNMHGATFKRPADVNADMPRPSCRLLATGQGELAKLALQGDTSPVADEFGRRGKKQVQEPSGPTTLHRNDNLYAHMTYKPLQAIEKTVLSKSLDDSRHFSKRHCPVPQAVGPGKGRDMLHWKPEQRIASYVPFAGLAQERRTSRLVASADHFD